MGQQNPIATSMDCAHLVGRITACNLDQTVFSSTGHRHLNGAAPTGSQLLSAAATETVRTSATHTCLGSKIRTRTVKGFGLGAQPHVNEAPHGNGCNTLLVPASGLLARAQHHTASVARVTASLSSTLDVESVLVHLGPSHSIGGAPEISRVRSVNSFAERQTVARRTLGPAIQLHFVLCMVQTLEASSSTGSWQVPTFKAKWSGLKSS